MTRNNYYLLCSSSTYHVHAEGSQEIIPWFYQGYNSEIVVIDQT